MFLDPVKLLLVAVVALVVLGPDKVPAAARKASSLLRDLQKFRTQVNREVQKAVGDLPYRDELRDAGQALARVRSVTSPRRAVMGALATPPPAAPPPGDAPPADAPPAAPPSADAPPADGPPSAATGSPVPPARSPGFDPSTN